MDTRYIYTLNTSVSELTELAKTNTLAWRRLTGELNTSVADFVRMYGTHIVVKSMVGGRTQLDYSLVADASRVSQSQFQELTASATVNALFFDETFSVTYTGGNQSSDVRNYLTTSFSSNAYGGSYPAIGNIKEPESFGDAYGKWCETLNDEPPPSSLRRSFCLCGSCFPRTSMPRESKSFRTITISSPTDKQ